MRHEDLEQVLEEKILDREILAIQIFWTQFCTPEDQTTVEQILNGQTVSDPVSRYRLEQYGYIVKDGDSWKIRVPLFETWLRRFAGTFEMKQGKENSDG